MSVVVQFSECPTATNIKWLWMLNDNAIRFKKNLNLFISSYIWAFNIISAPIMVIYKISITRVLFP
jgi:hypothetical protein